MLVFLSQNISWRIIWRWVCIGSPLQTCNIELMSSIYLQFLLYNTKYRSSLLSYLLQDGEDGFAVANHCGKVKLSLGFYSQHGTLKVTLLIQIQIQKLNQRQNQTQTANIRILPPARRSQSNQQRQRQIQRRIQTQTKPQIKDFIYHLLIDQYVDQ